MRRSDNSAEIEVTFQNPAQIYTDWRPRSISEWIEDIAFAADILRDAP
jgi:hypothetical protein